MNVGQGGEGWHLPAGEVTRPPAQPRLSEQQQAVLDRLVVNPGEPVDVARLATAFGGDLFSLYGFVWRLGRKVKDTWRITPLKQGRRIKAYVACSVSEPVRKRGPKPFDLPFRPEPPKTVTYEVSCSWCGDLFWREVEKDSGAGAVARLVGPRCGRCGGVLRIHEDCVA